MGVFEMHASAMLHYQSLVNCVLHEALWHLSLLFQPCLSICVSHHMPRLLVWSSRSYQGLILSHDPQCDQSPSWLCFDSPLQIDYYSAFWHVFSVNSSHKNAELHQETETQRGFPQRSILLSFFLQAPPSISIDAPGRPPAMFRAAASGHFPVFLCAWTPLSPMSSCQNSTPFCRIQHESPIAPSCPMRTEPIFLCVPITL